MNNILNMFLIILVPVLLITIILGALRTSKVQSSLDQKEFLMGQIPSPLPDGFLKGNVWGLKTDWQGKTFDATNSSGINIFKKNGVQSKSFPFKTYIGDGLQDKNLKVFKIDYSNSSPWWAKFVLDELVEISPGQYLGKVHLKIIPGLPFTVGFFRLEK